MHTIAQKQLRHVFAMNGKFQQVDRLKWWSGVYRRKMKTIKHTHINNHMRVHSRTFVQIKNILNSIRCRRIWLHRSEVNIKILHSDFFSDTFYLCFSIFSLSVLAFCMLILDHLLLYVTSLVGNLFFVQFHFISFISFSVIELFVISWEQAMSHLSEEKRKHPQILLSSLIVENGCNYEFRESYISIQSLWSFIEFFCCAKRSLSQIYSNNIQCIFFKYISWILLNVSDHINSKLIYCFEKEKKLW